MPPPGDRERAGGVGSLAAAQLQADHVTIAYSGIGMVRNHGGDTVNPMP